MCVIKKLTVKSEKDNIIILLIGLYLPHSTCTIANYDDEVEELEEIVQNTYTENCHIVIMEDVNAHFGVEVDQICRGKTSINAKKMTKFMNRNVGSSGQSPVYTF